jgi:hypothetical protein
MRSCGKMRCGGAVLLLLASAGLANVAAQDDEIPGGTLKDARSQKRGNEVISESTLEVLSFKVP